MNVVVEGSSDEDAARRVVQSAGHTVTKVYIKRGKANLDAALPKYAKAAVREPWVVFRDSDNECPVTLRDRLLNTVPVAPSLFHLRIAHTMTEAWFLADSVGFGEYFGVSPGKVPGVPEALPHAKATLLQLCAKSRRRAIREEVVRHDNQPGPLFVHHLNTFATQRWDIAAAAGNSPSLRRAITALRGFQQGEMS